MRAMLLESRRPIEKSPLRAVEVPDPEPGPGEALVRLRYCAICRTDLHVIEGELPARKLPVIPGHQAIGEVERLGPGCRLLRAGQRVGIAWLRSTCGSCAYCRSGKENLCESSRYNGYDADGGYAARIALPEAFAYPIPAALDDLAAVPLLCAGIIGYRALRRSNLPPSGALGLFGFGSSAHLVLQLARAEGARVLAITRDPGHQELARELGAAWAGGEASRLPEALDSAILFAPAGELIPQALESLRKGGTLAVAGIHVSRIPELDYRRDLFYERDLRTVTANTREDGRELLERAARSGVRAQYRLYPLEQANEALQDLKADRIRGTGILRMPGP